jgi:hypothetical protein
LTVLLVTIDVEEDSPNWHHSLSPTVNNIDRLAQLQKLFNKYSVKPTLLVNYSVISQKKAVDCIKKIIRESNLEIGTHVHPWNTPPSCPLDGEDKYPHRIPYKYELNKIKTTTDLIDEHFGKPTTFRAGRYDFNINTFKIIKKFNYTVDTSFTPHVDWGLIGGESFIKSPESPFYLNRYYNQNKTNRDILEVPISIVLKSYQKPIQNIFSRYISMPMYNIHNYLKPIVTCLKPLKPIWLRPSYSSISQMKYVADDCISCQKPLNLMFHSNELLEGASIFSKNKSQIREVYNKLDVFLRYITKKGVKSLTCQQYRDSYCN